MKLYELINENETIVYILATDLASAVKIYCDDNIYSTTVKSIKLFSQDVLIANSDN